MSALYFFRLMSALYFFRLMCVGVGESVGKKNLKIETSVGIILKAPVGKCRNLRRISTSFVGVVLYLGSGTPTNKGENSSFRGGNLPLGPLARGGWVRVDLRADRVGCSWGGGEGRFLF